MSCLAACLDAHNLEETSKLCASLVERTSGRVTRPVLKDTPQRDSIRKPLGNKGGRKPLSCRFFYSEVPSE